MLFESAMAPPPYAIGLGAGGSITQSIATPRQPHENWELGALSTALVRIVTAPAWQELTGRPVPSEPLTIAEYTDHGYPWFEWYDDSLARSGSSPLSDVRSVKQVGDLSERSHFPATEVSIHRRRPPSGSDRLPMSTAVWPEHQVDVPRVADNCPA